MTAHLAIDYMIVNCRRTSVDKQAALFRYWSMLAAVTTRPNRIELVHRPAPGQPPPGHVLLRLEMVGVCGSDAHLYSGDTSALSGGAGAYPRVQGHEISAVVEAVGEGCPPQITVGGRVAVWPLSSCGGCYPCRRGRPNACIRFQLLGVHTDGGLQERLTVPAGQVFPAGALSPYATAFVEPVSVGVHAVRRAAVAPDEHVVVLGVGPIGLATCLAARAAGASVLAVDPLAGRREMAAKAGAETFWGPPGDLARAARDWAGDDGPPVVVDTTGDPVALPTALDLVARTGRVVVVGLTAGRAPVSSGIVVTKELDVLGSACCVADDFAAAVRVVTEHADVVAGLPFSQVPLPWAKQAMLLATGNSADVLKVLVTID